LHILAQKYKLVQTNLKGNPMSTIEEKPQPDRQRKSLAVDQRTYDLLQEICFDQRRSKIDQLKILIEHEHDRLFLAAGIEA
tara:strand:- start:1349 stop:1591 length:243 start_codon:yes stop_codon:yes gene_type:complete